MEKYILQHSGEEIDNLLTKIDNVPENLASETFVKTEIANLIDSAPETLNTLGEIADAIEENDTVVDTLNAAIGNKANSSDVLTKTNTTAFTPTANYHPATKTYVDAKFVKGMIMMWSGNINSVPTGWALCNGSNGTPDLRNRFIVGAGSTYSIGNTGGSASVTLTEANLPAHTHTATASETEMGLYYQIEDHDDGYRTNRAVTSIRREDNSSKWDIDLSHTHTVTIGSTGSGTAHENRPPYYALAFIMKL